MHIRAENTYTSMTQQVRSIDRIAYRELSTDWLTRMNEKHIVNDNRMFKCA
jgi:hypothetical protein